MEQIVAESRRAHFGRKSERITDDQLALALDELETAAAKCEAEAEKPDPKLKTERAKQRRKPKLPTTRAWSSPSHSPPDSNQTASEKAGTVHA